MIKPPLISTVKIIFRELPPRAPRAESSAWTLRNLDRETCRLGTDDIWCASLHLPRILQRIFHLTNLQTCGSLYFWSFCGHIVVGARRKSTSSEDWRGPPVRGKPGGSKNEKSWERSEEVIENKGRALKNEAKMNPD